MHKFVLNLLRNRRRSLVLRLAPPIRLWNRANSAPGLSRIHRSTLVMALFLLDSLILISLLGNMNMLIVLALLNRPRTPLRTLRHVLITKKLSTGGPLGLHLGTGTAAVTLLLLTQRLTVLLEL